MSKPYGLLSDSHFHNWDAFSHLTEEGVNNRLVQILDVFETCAHKVQALGGDTIFHGGDLFHVRGSIPPSVLNYVKDRLERIARAYDIGFVFMPGNHDMEFNDSKAIGYATGSLGADWIEVVSEPCRYGNVIVVPWHDSLDELRKTIGTLAYDDGKDDLIIHAPMNGVIKGIPDHGLEAEEVAKWGFKRVFCGHYHSHKVFCDGMVYSIGATTHQTFSDVGTLAGYMIVHEGRADFFESAAPKFKDYDFAWGADQILAMCKDSYMRIRLGDCTEEEIRFIRDEVMKAGALAVRIEATPTTTKVEREYTAIESGQSLLQSITSYVEADENIKEKDSVLKECVEILAEVEAVA